MLRSLCFFACFAANVLSAHGQEDVKATFAVARPKFAVGEPVVVTCTFINSSQTPVTVQYGKNGISAFDVKSMRPDPQLIVYPYEPSGAYATRQETVEPGKSVSHSIILQNWIMFLAPAQFELQVSHGTGKAESKGVVTFEIIDDPKLLEDSLRNYARMMHESVRKNDHAMHRIAMECFFALRTDAAVGPLVEIARSGDVKAVEALGRIRTPKGEAALEALRSSDSPAVAGLAATLLEQRQRK